MSIRKRVWKGGKEAWQVDLLLRGKRIRKQFSTKADAKAFELEKRREARDGTYLADGSKVAVADLVSDYLDTLEKRCQRGARMTPATLKSQRGHLLNYIVGGRVMHWRKPFRAFPHGLGSMKFDELSADTVEAFCENLLDFGLSVKTVREVRNTLSGLLDLARRRKYLAVNPAKGMRFLASSEAQRKRKIIPPPKELVAAIIEDAGSDLSLKVKFAALTGLRASEQWALRWYHVDLERGYVRVETKLDALTKREGITKTEAGNREVPISRDLVQDLQAWRMARPAGDVSDLVFPSAGGGYVRHDGLRQRFYKVYDRVIKKWPLGVVAPKRPRWHDLRHFAVSCWIEAGLPPKAIQEFAGHASLQMTMDRYGHLFPSVDHRNVMDMVAEGVFASARHQD